MNIVNYKRYCMDLVYDQVIRILPEQAMTVYLGGSLAAGAFAPGWSDIDLLFIKDGAITADEAADLVHLKGLLSILYPGNRYIRLYEGAFVSKGAFLGDGKGTMVYWGGSRERITHYYHPDAFSRLDLLDNARLLMGRDLRPSVIRPSHEEIYHGVYGCYRNIRRFASRVAPTLASAGFMLDLARGLYTLQYDRLISKTDAGRWALEQGFCPEPQVMEKILEIRANADIYKEDRAVCHWMGLLGPHIQAMADVLETHLKRDEQLHQFCNDGDLD